jgi:hypothetical protein
MGRRIAVEGQSQGEKMGNPIQKIGKSKKGLEAWLKW